MIISIDRLVEINNVLDDMFDKVCVVVKTMRGDGLVSEATRFQIDFIAMHDRVMAKHAAAMSAARGWDTAHQEQTSNDLMNELNALKQFAHDTSKHFHFKI